VFKIGKSMQLGPLKNRLSKYKWSFYLLLGYLLIDAYVHKGMLRVLLPSSFHQQVLAPQLPQCASSLLHKGGKWKKGVNAPNALPEGIQEYDGVEMDAYFDTAKADYLLFHDSSESQRLPIEIMIRSLADKGFSGSLWLDFKNLSAENEKAALVRLVALTRNYQLNSKVIVESGHPELLQSFCREGFFTSYYVPFFNPYLMNAEERTANAQLIAKQCTVYPVSALSGYYFQYPFLKEGFPAIPLLTWVDNPRWSLVNYFFQRKLHQDPSLQIVLTN
jgi:heptose-I-phosphate ethanolaminephosphotransferase